MQPWGPFASGTPVAQQAPQVPWASAIAGPPDQAFSLRTEPAADPWESARLRGKPGCGVLRSTRFHSGKALRQNEPPIGLEPGLRTQRLFGHGEGSTRRTRDRQRQGACGRQRCERQGVVAAPANPFPPSHRESETFRTFGEPCVVATGRGCARSTSRRTTGSGASGSTLGAADGCPRAGESFVQRNPLGMHQAVIYSTVMWRDSVDSARPLAGIQPGRFSGRGDLEGTRFPQPLGPAVQQDAAPAHGWARRGRAPRWPHLFRAADSKILRKRPVPPDAPNADLDTPPGLRG